MTKNANPLNNLSREERNQTMAKLISDPGILSVAAQYGFEMHEISGEIFEKLIETKPRKPVRNLNGWLASNVVHRINRIRSRETKQRLLQLEEQK